MRESYKILGIPAAPQQAGQFRGQIDTMATPVSLFSIT